MVKIRTELLEQYAENESSLERSDVSEQPSKVIEHALKSGIATHQVKEKNQESEEMSVAEHQERLKSTFSHDGSGSSETEDLSDDDRSVKDIQSELADRVFSHD